MSWMSFVHCTGLGNQSTFFFRSKFRLQICVRVRPVRMHSERIRATELPTVPKPKMATLQVPEPASTATVECLCEEFMWCPDP